jgi:hypothetical protein
VTASPVRLARPPRAAAATVDDTDHVVPTVRAACQYAVGSLGGSTTDELRRRLAHGRRGTIDPFFQLGIQAKALHSPSVSGTVAS